MEAPSLCNSRPERHDCKDWSRGGYAAGINSELPQRGRTPRYSCSTLMFGSARIRRELLKVYDGQVSGSQCRGSSMLMVK
jgi:hypothetical protein